MLFRTKFLKHPFLFFWDHRNRPLMCSQSNCYRLSICIKPLCRNPPAWVLLPVMIVLQVYLYKRGKGNADCHRPETDLLSPLIHLGLWSSLCPDTSSDLKLSRQAEVETHRWQLWELPATKKLSTRGWWLLDLGKLTWWGKHYKYVDNQMLFRTNVNTLINSVQTHSQFQSI